MGITQRYAKKYLESILNAGSNRNDSMPRTFVEWIRWKLGDKITCYHIIEKWFLMN